ncbi:unnamed protein product [Rangifer tarandus platyrhynchus]|uniref:Uncharacterized protein n=1 Tax=Rangifer tarandus platyrhynchus TaxID=3082113 RepID=A0AC59ZNG2_RANTA
MEVLYWKHVREQLETLQKLQRRKAAEQRHLQGLHLRSLWRKMAGRTLPKTREQQMTSIEPREDAATEAAAMPVSLRCEELVQKNVELFVTTSKQELIQETELKQHVRDWEDTIQTLLQEQEEHVPVDIHTCGDQMVSRFSSLNHWHPFAKLVAGQPAFEVCCSMLASLQLANDHTVEITQQPGLEVARGHHVPETAHIPVGPRTLPDLSFPPRQPETFTPSRFLLGSQESREVADCSRLQFFVRFSLSAKPLPVPPPLKPGGFCALPVPAPQR